MPKPPALSHLCIGSIDQNAHQDPFSADGLQPGRLVSRFNMLRAFNALVKTTIPYVDLSLLQQPGSIASLVSACRHLIFSELKMELWEQALEATATDRGLLSSVEVLLSRSRAAMHRATRRPDLETAHTIFAQAFRQLRTLPGRSYRLRSGASLYSTILRGEMAHDAGGPYRETFTMYADELQLPALRLFVRCPNAVNNVGVSREKWVPNPSATSALDLEMLAFVGKLMGLAVRTRQYLELNLPSIVWKQLVGQTLVREDLEAVDIMLVQSMVSVRTIERQGVTEEGFQDVIMETFTTLTTDDRVVELLPGGAERPVTFRDRGEFADLVEYQLREFHTQVAAMQQGLAQVLPRQLLTLFTWEELQVQVCGESEVDVELLEACTEYNDCNPDQPHVQYFWDVLRHMFSAEYALFLSASRGDAPGCLCGRTNFANASSCKRSSLPTELALLERLTQTHICPLHTRAFSVWTCLFTRALR